MLMMEGHMQLNGCHSNPDSSRDNQSSVDLVVVNPPTHTPEAVHLRKRQRSPLHKTSCPVRRKTEVNHSTESLLSPAFWDTLSEVLLTRNALRELDRRNIQAARSVVHTQISKPVTRAALARWKKKNQQATQPATKFLDCCTPHCLKDIQRFAKRGGPDISELRGYYKPASPLLSAMDSKLLGCPVKFQTGTTKKTGPYDRNFQQHLIRYGIYPFAYEYPDGTVPPGPSNLDQLKERFARRRASLSLSTFTQDSHQKFIRANAHAFKEKQVTETVIPMIEGDVGDHRCAAGGIPFRNLKPLTMGTIVPGNPDRYYGARREQLKQQVLEKLNGQIVPSTQHDLPIVPNFFLAAKEPDGSLAVAGRQASYDGALGARGIHSLQAYGQREQNFDNKAFTITSIYHGGTLTMFTIHPIKLPTSNRTEYHMTQINSWSMTGNIDAFIAGATWYRNARDWAREKREESIHQANERATRQI